MGCNTGVGIVLKNCYYRDYFCSELGLTEDERTDYLLKDIRRLVNKGQTISYFERSKDNAEGLVIIEKLPWDSNYFGIEMAGIPYVVTNRLVSYERNFAITDKLLSAALKKCLKKKIKFLSAKINMRDLPAIHCLEKHGFRQMSVCATYIVKRSDFLSYAKAHPVKPGNYCTVRPHQIQETGTLVALSKNACIKSHFRNDHLLPQDKVGDLYSEWIKNSCKGLADKVMVITVDNKIIGCNTFSIDRRLFEQTRLRLATLPLIIFSEKARGKKFYGFAVTQLLFKYYFRRADVIECVNQIDNLKAVKHLFPLGARMVNCFSVFHKWLNT